MPKKLKVKKVKPRIKVLKALPYRGIMIYLRMVNDDIFMYDLAFKGEIYSAYFIMKPKKGFIKLSEGEINQSAALILAGATATIDTLLGKKLDKKIKGVVKIFEKAREKFEGKGAIN